MEGLLEMLALAYLNGDAVQPTKDEINGLHSFIVNQYDQLPVLCRFVPEEVTPEAMIHHHKTTGELIISTLYTDHPYLNADQNCMLRAVHDWHHLSQGFGFDFIGELSAATYIVSLAPKYIQWMLFSEVALQAAASIYTGEFQPQKMVKI